MKQKRVDLLIGIECNLHCSFCLNYPFLDKFDNDDFSFNKLKSVLESGQKKGITSLSIAGGEPTISKDFFKVVRLASKLGYNDIRIITNGLMFSYDSFAKKASDIGITQICVSLHGNSPRLNEKATNVPNSFLKAVKGVNNIKKYFKNIQLTAHTVITKDIVPFLNEHTDFLIKTGFNAVNFLYLMPNSKTNRLLAPDSDATKYKLKEVIDAYKDKIYIHIGYFEPCLMPGYEEYFDSNDFDMEFTSNCNDFFEEWRKTLIKNKTKTKECYPCRFLKTCMGHWNTWKGLDNLKLLKKHVQKITGDNAGKYNVEANYDPALSYAENITLINEDLKSKGLKKKEIVQT